MTLRIGFIFLASFLILLLGFHGLSYYIRHQQEHTIRKQSRIILENVKDRFKLFIRVPITVGTLGAEHFATNNLMTKEYGPFNLKLIQLREEIIGLNIMDEKGRIIRVFPKTVNKDAVGHVSQNYSALMKSLIQGDPYWFSPPFQLYQGIYGFAVYFPILSRNELRGWFAIVLSTEAFIKQFKLDQFLKTYNLIIKDKATDRPYFVTGVEASSDKIIHDTTAIVDGRELVFKIWRKNPKELTFFPWNLSIIASLILAFFVVLLYRLNEQKKKVRTQLEDVSTLLKLTSKEALSKLVDLQTEMYKLGSGDTIHYITHLIEQIDLLQTTANTKKEIECEDIEILPFILNELDELKDLTDKKNLKININPENFLNVTFYINTWLFRNSILNNILTHLIVNSEAGTGISIEYQKNFNKHTIVFHAQRLHQFEVKESTINMDRRMSVTKKILQIFDGELISDQDLAGGLIIRIILPIQKKIKRPS